MANGPELGTAFVHVVPSADGIKGSLEGIMSGEADSAGFSAGKNIAGAIKRALVAAGIGKVFKDILGEGGALQQSYIGGIDTLYGDSADMMRQNAMAAAQYGISANNYAEQAVSFGAALKQSFADAADATEAEALAAEAANLAIIDMADNSAKFGTDIGAIQTAYQGFAKQNYTMLDNLKLGYGGTKTEMERLLKDAEKISGIHYDINNLADVYSAIHVIQDELGVTNTAATEAGDTLTGSMNAVKASLQNLYGSIALGENIEPALQTFVESVGNFLVNNLAPMGGRIIAAIPSLINSITPAIVTGLNNLANNGESIGGFAVQFVGNLAMALVTNLPQIGYAMIGAFGGILSGILSGIAGNLDALATGAIDKIKSTLTAYGIPQMITNGIEAIKGFATGILNGIGEVLNSITQIINNAKTAFTSFDWAGLGRDIINGIVNGIKGAAGAIGSALVSAAGNAWESAKDFLRIGSPSKLFADTVGAMIPAGIAVGITDGMGVLNSAIEDMNTGITADVNGAATYNAPAYSPMNDLASLLNDRETNSNVTVVLQGDTAKLFKVVRQENNTFKTRTGKSAFNY